MKPALLVIDVQNEWLEGSDGLRASVEMRAEAINEVIAIFRKKELPIIVVYHMDKDGSPTPGTKGFEFHQSIKIEGTDKKVVKNYPNAFNRTELERILKDEGCDTVLLAGLSATGCVLATFFGAIDKDFSPYLVRDAVAGSREDLVRFVEEICDSLSLKAISQFINESQKRPC
jgi:nicotinamidase-related amidase